MVYLLSILGGLFYRQRGGGYKFPISFGTQGTRVFFWAVPTAFLVDLIAYYNDDLWLDYYWFGAFTVFTAFIGLLFGHGAHQRSTYVMLTNENPKWTQTELLTCWLPYAFGGSYQKLSYPLKELYHWIGASIINCTRLFLICLPLVIDTLDASHFAYCLWGFIPAYFIGWRIPVVFPKAKVKNFLEEGTAWGEFCTGIVLWFAIICMYA